MNFKSRITQKLPKFLRIQRELEEDLDDIEAYNPEIGADIRWSLITLARAISGLQKGRK